MTVPSIVHYTALDGNGQIVYPGWRQRSSQGTSRFLWLAISALTDAAIINPSWAPASGVSLWTQKPTPTGTTPVTDAGALTFATAAGRTVKLLVPGLALSHYLADHETVNPADTLVAALIVQAKVQLADAGDNLVTTYVAGTRVHLSQPPLGRYL